MCLISGRWCSCIYACCLDGLHMVTANLIRMQIIHLLQVSATKVMQPDLLCYWHDFQQMHLQLRQFGLLLNGHYSDDMQQGAANAFAVGTVRPADEGGLWGPNQSPRRALLPASSIPFLSLLHHSCFRPSTVHMPPSHKLAQLSVVWKLLFKTVGSSSNTSSLLIWNRQGW